ncbi:MAG: VOC family protein, partial [Actinobacteria bacterium]|nr:VOC family protein [Actinomycetota bacterium]NIU77731.1 VOC family protein [Gammaproteobacteria bacterium]NIV57603.1 VOC family protein [Actinomycetota bacterium]
MSDQAEHDLRVDYVEFPAVDMTATRAFYERVFGWRFTMWGDAYMSFEDGRLAGGFRQAEAAGGGGPLVVIYALDLEAVKAAITEAGGNVTVDTFEFPGGRRFHF